MTYLKGILEQEGNEGSGRPVMKVGNAPPRFLVKIY